MPTQNYAWIWRGSYTWNFLLDFTNPSGKYNYGNWPRGTCHGPYDLGELSILLLIGSNTFSAQFIKTISHDKKIGYAWWSTQSRLATLLSSLIARRWVGLQNL